MTRPPNEKISKKLPKAVALQVADIACVPVEEREPFFCDCICGAVKMVWDRDRRATTSSSGPALLQAAKAARNLYEAVCNLNKEDRDWVEKLLAQEPSNFQEQLRNFPHAAWLLAFLFSNAIGRSIPLISANSGSSGKLRRRPGTVNDMTFQVFVRHLLLIATEAGGEFTLDKNSNKGTLIDTLNILRPHLPKGLVPNVLPVGTLQKIKSKYLKSRRSNVSPK